MFASGGASGASATTTMVAIAPETAYAWGAFGNVVKVTTDAGHRWWESGFGAGVCSVSSHDVLLQARAFGVQPGPGGETEIFLYVSRDHGLTWTLQGRLGNNPSCGLPRGPKVTTVCAMPTLPEDLSGTTSRPTSGVLILVVCPPKITRSERQVEPSQAL